MHLSIWISAKTVDLSKSVKLAIKLRFAQDPWKLLSKIRLTNITIHLVSIKCFKLSIMVYQSNEVFLYIDLSNIHKSRRVNV